MYMFMYKVIRGSYLYGSGMPAAATAGLTGCGWAIGGCVGIDGGYPLNPTDGTRPGSGSLF